MIGIYDYTVILTYSGLIFSVLGIVQALGGRFPAALLCLGCALLCDTFDGAVARSKRGRTAREKMFGIQIDSLCDLVSFGVFPALICYRLGVSSPLEVCLIGYYCLCCVIRLGYFNVLAQERQPGEKSVYHGLPVIGMTMLLPAVLMVGQWIPKDMLLWLLRGMLPIFGTLYILDFKIEKPGLYLSAALCLIFWIPLTVILLLGWVPA